MSTNRGGVGGDAWFDRADDATDASDVRGDDMTPRIHGVKERMDKIWYDTIWVEPNKEERMFDHVRIGDEFLTNMRVSGQLGYDSAFTLLAFGLRLIGKGREEATMLLDHIRFVLTLGDKPMFDMLGGAFALMERTDTEEQSGYGHKLKSPIHVLDRQRTEVRVRAADTLPAGAPARGRRRAVARRGGRPRSAAGARVASPSRGNGPVAHGASGAPAQSCGAASRQLRAWRDARGLRPERCGAAAG